MKNNLANMAIQVLPRSKDHDTYALVDSAIEVIQKSGLNYIVCPFETVVEGTFDQLMDLLKQVHEAVYVCGAENMITNVKIQTNKDQDVFIDDKIGKYK